MLQTEVIENRSKCPVYQGGAKMAIDDPKILLDRTDALCAHALSALLHYTTILQHDCRPVRRGLTMPQNPDYAYMQCVDTGEPYTQGGTVIFECRRIEEGSSK
jgi:uncharacterized repeat protein (TIGR04076 family)